MGHATKWLAAGAIALAAAVPLSTTASAQSSVTVMRQIDTDRYDPHTSTARSTAEIMFMVGDTLVALGPDMKTIHPLLAKSWEVSEDGKLYTFHLRDDVTFCSGKKFTAADVKATIDRWLNLDKGVVKNRAGDVKEVRAVDDYTVEYELVQPYSELLYQMTQHFHTIINVDQVNELGDDFGVKGFDGTGPYCFESWEPRNELVMTKHDAYTWGPAFYETQGPAKVDKVVWKIVPEENNVVAGIQTGQGDVTQYLPYWSIDQLEANPQISVTQPPFYFWTFYIGFKITRDNVSDVKVREAINLAVDQKALAEGPFFGKAEPATAYVHPGTLDYSEEAIDESLFGYDPEKAATLLDEAGWKMGDDGFRYKDGKKLELVTYSFTNIWRQLTEAVQGDLRKVGIDMQVELFDATVVWGKLKTQDFDMYTMSYPYVSAGDALNLYFPSANMPSPNRMNWDDKETDQWLFEARGALNDADRAAAYAKVEKKVHDAVVWIPLVHEPMFVAAGPKLKPVEAHGIYGAGLYKGLSLEMK
ncbi:MULTISPECIES: ABC transporter substrate-binding protein [Thalassobaculum]|uniref:Peptide/nickel transport system substrate-binding protein n=1 Tax=Thalassobaculum litoreum DSM 18839 TaxID=1123362 RepID=A0A8G2BIG6_9PROT|nr:MULTISPECIES: ABC transporter substrate-binding protein [Thalassobaculum]SDF43350.1 peptide/nickel transport system substrate-binding protein [Thalassobaculum litoreum DSM 18839]